MDDAGAFFGFGLHTGLAYRQPIAPDAGKGRYSSFLSGKPDTYAIAIGKWAVFGGGKTAGIRGKIANRSGFLPE
ncbi:MAG: hypothetical protein OXF19_05865, partial [Hyphomicrobiales bacterium]|nr:hypothetical protein [Hyphomicrobiales bacterium]